MRGVGAVCVRCTGVHSASQLFGEVQSVPPGQRIAAQRKAAVLLYLCAPNCTAKSEMLTGDLCLYGASGAVRGLQIIHSRLTIACAKLIVLNLYTLGSYKP